MQLTKVQRPILPQQRISFLSCALHKNLSFVLCLPLVEEALRFLQRAVLLVSGSIYHNGQGLVTKEQASMAEWDVSFKHEGM